MRRRRSRGNIRDLHFPASLLRASPKQILALHRRERDPGINRQHCRSSRRTTNSIHQSSRSDKMLTKAGCVITTIMLIGAVPAALAGDQTEERGGYVMPGSLDGVNPVYHPGIFGNPAVAKAYGFVQYPDHTWHVRSIWRQRARGR
jgi:hypothetical protein